MSEPIVSNITTVVTTTANSTNTTLFSELNSIDKLAIIIPYKIYSNDKINNFLKIYPFLQKIYPGLINGIFFILIACFIIIIGSYTTISKPKNAQDPIIDKDSINNDKLFDPTDRDESQFFKMNNLDLQMLNVGVINYKYALCYPFIGGGVLYLLNYSINNLNFEKLIIGLNWYILSMISPIIYSNYYYLITWITRNLGFKLKLKNNSGWFFPRYRISISKSREESYPLGIVEEISSDKLIGYNDYKWLTKFKNFLIEKNEILILKPTNVKKQDQEFNLIFDYKWIILLPISILHSVGYYFTNPILNSSSIISQSNWLITNYIGINFAIFGIKQTKLSNFKTNCLLLSGLFFYDIYFVFGTTLMENVATKLDIPVKIILPGKPKNIVKNLSEIYQDLINNYNDISFSLLGLGDIVLPGTFISTLLRFDLFKYHQCEIKPFHHLNSFPKIYFITGLISYIISLILTMVVLFIFQKGQPALLYIVPCLFIGVSTVAYIRGEFKQIWNYKEELIEFNEKPRSKKEIKEDDNEVDDEFDSDYIESEIDESYDDWENKVEEGNLEEEEENIIELLIKDQDPRSTYKPPIIYEFGDDSDDDDDDTFIIDEETDEDDEEILKFSEEDEEDEDDEEIDDYFVKQEEINILKKDNENIPRVWYADNDEE